MAPQPGSSVAADNDVARLVEKYPGIVFVSLPEINKVDVRYDARQVSQDQLVEFASELEKKWQAHTSRCTLWLQGRACETCALKIEKNLRSLPGIRHASISFLNGAASVVFDHSVLSPAELIERLRAAGTPLLVSRRFQSVWRRILSALDSQRGGMTLVVLAGVLLAAGYMLTRLVPGHWLVSIVWGLCYVAGGYSGAKATIASLRQKVLDIDLLMVLAALGAAYIGAPAEGATLLFLFSLSHVLQHYAVGRARSAIASLIKLRPATASVLQDGEVTTLPVEQVEVGRTIILKPGERIPLDGTVTTGSGSVDQAAVTGESVPVDKQPGDEVFAGTINQEGSLEVRVTRAATDSTLARMISLVESAQAEKARTQRLLETAEQYYAMGVILFTILLATVPVALGWNDFSPAFYRAISVMVVASPCALILSTPASILSAIAGLGRNGILAKGGIHLEDGARIKAVALDKTGTITEGKPVVTDIHPLPGVTDENNLLDLLAQAERRSEHPLAQAIISEARHRGMEPTEPREYSSITGRGGVSVLADDTRILFGSLKLMREHRAAHYKQLESHTRQLELDGKTVICVARVTDDATEGLGVLGMQDVLRSDARQTIDTLKRMGIHRIAMLTGDSAGVANAIAKQAGISEVYAGLMPEDKVDVIRQISRESPVIMVGDGINDAPALAMADLGMAMGAAGTDVAMETADIVLMSHTISQLPVFLATSRKARRVVTQNLVFSFAVVVILVTAALGWHLPLSLGVLAHEGSTVLVCLNGLRLLRPVRP